MWHLLSSVPKHCWTSDPVVTFRLENRIQFPAQGDGPHHFASNTGMPLGRTSHQLCVPYKRDNTRFKFSCNCCAGGRAAPLCQQHGHAAGAHPRARPPARRPRLAGAPVAHRTSDTCSVHLPAHALLPLPDGCRSAMSAGPGKAPLVMGTLGHHVNGRDVLHCLAP